MPDYIIRCAVPEDLSHLLELYAELYQGLQNYEMPFELDVINLESVVALQLKSKLYHVVVAEKNGILQGFISASMVRVERRFSCGDNNMMGYINDIYVAPELRCSGAATALLNAAESWLKEANIKLLECNVLRSNTTGHSFWNNSQFKELGKIYYKEL